ncbi:MAG: hypothetical protein IT493_00480 [Gammaproteobacteria bacterium]|nr:hypothetical protein [Gammaproteobacteria bacterium]
MREAENDKEIREQVMLRIKSLVTVLDVLGAGALVAATLALIDASGVVAIVPVAEALPLFTAAFALAIAAFALARALQIVHVMRTRIDPRRARERRATEIEVLSQSEAAPSVPNPYQRAA